ncbi:2579_t:CDS:2, partial [Funneliformis caledonium]
LQVSTYVSVEYFNGICYQSIFELVLRVGLQSFVLKKNTFVESTTEKFVENELEWRVNEEVLQGGIVFYWMKVQATVNKPGNYLS